MACCCRGGEETLEKDGIADGGNDGGGGCGCETADSATVKVVRRLDSGLRTEDTRAAEETKAI